MAAGTPFSYVINWANPSTTQDAHGAILTDVLPTQLSWAASDVSFSSSATYVSSAVYNPTTGTMTWTFVDPLPAGTSGQFTLTSLFPNGTTPNGTVAVNTASLSQTGGSTATSSPATITATASSQVSVTKTLTAGGAAGEDTTYTVAATNSTAAGGLNLNGAVLTDYLPTNAVFISATDSATYNSTFNTVTWPSTTLAIGTGVSHQITVLYPSPTFGVSQTVTNNVTLVGTPVGASSPVTNKTSQVATLSNPTAYLSAVKTLNSGGAAGDETTYTVSASNSSSSDTLMTNVVMIDSLPTGAVFISATESGTYNSSANTVIWTNSSLAIGSTTNHSVTVLYPTPTFQSGNKVTNNLTVIGTPYGGNSYVTNTASLATTLSNPTSFFTVSKTLTSGGAVNQNTTYTVTASNSSSSDTILTNVVLIDTLPVSANFISATGGGTYSGNTVTWPATNIAIGGSASYTVTVLYATNAVASSVTNLLTGIAYPPGPSLPITNSTSLKTTLANASSFLTTSKSFNSGGAVGEQTKYTVSAKNSSSSGLTMTNVVLVDFLPTNVFFVSATGSGAYNSTSNTVTWPAATITPGSTDSQTVIITYPPSNYSSGSVATNNLNVVAYLPGGYSVTNTASVTTTLTGSSTLYTVSKTLRSGGAVGNNTEYAVTMNNPSSSGVTLTNVVMTDTLPTGASFVSATGSGVYNSSLGTVTWPAASVSANSSTTQYVIVNYPTNLFTSGQKITNVLSVIATPPGLTPVSASATNVATLTAPTDSVGFSKTASATVATIGSTSINYTLNITNTGNTVLTNYQVVDIIPAGVTVTDVQIDPVNAYEAEQGAGTVTLEYSTSAATPYTWTTVTGTPGTSFVRKNSSLPAITAVRWTFSSVPPGFTSKSFASGTGSGLSATFSSAIADGTTVANCASYTYSTTYGTPTQKSGSSCVNVLAVNGQTAALVATKAAATGVNPGSAITYTVGVAAGNSLATVANPVIADLVPSGLTYVSGSWAVVSGPTPVLFENIPNYNGTSQTLLRWTYSAAVGTNGAKVSFQATVPSGITYGASYTNTSYVVNWANSAVSGNTTTDINDLNGNGSTSDTIAASTPVVVKVNRAATLNSLKYVIGQLDVNYSRYPTNGNSVPGGVANYKLTVQNSGDVSLTNILIIDILPFVGDTGVVDLSPRNTAWRPNLASTVTAPSGVTVYYSTASNPSRPEMGVTTSYPANWSTVPPSDLTTVQSLKFDFGTTVLGPQDQLELDWAMRVPVDAPTDGSIAWNSFGVVGTPIDTLTPFNATEPIKVGIAAEPIKPAAWGDFVWNDANHNGIQDTGEVGIDSVRVELYNHTGSQTNADPTLDTYIGFTVTSGGGKYLFSSLAPGNYYAVFFTPPTYLVSPARQGTDSTKDSDGTATTVHGFPATITPIFTLNSGDVTLNEDQGFYQPTVPINSVGDYVWNDLNADGIQNEPAANGLNGIGVQIYTGAGVLVSSTTTANDLNGNPGYYQFNGLTNGSYYVQFSLPSADSFTTANAVGSTTNTDSDVVVVGSNYGKTATFTLSGGQYDSSRDAGLLLPTGPMSLGDFVWLDTNGNGLEDDGQTGINGVKVNLYKDSDNNGVYTPGTDQFIATTTTYTVGGNPGFYSFTSLPVGKYIVQIDPSNFGAGGTLNGLVPSGPQPPPTPNSDTTNDNKGYLLTTNGVVTAVVTLTLNGEPGPNGSNNNGTIDFGFNQYVTIGDFVWVDTNGNGVQDAGEPGISGVTLTLAGTSAGGASITSHTTTDANGHYSFSEPPGTYTVTVDSSNSTNALAGYSLTASGQGTTSTDSNPNPSGTTPVALNSGTSDSTIDFGYYKPVTIGDFVWLDTNGNGIQDNGELGIAGVTLTLSGTNAAGASVTDQAATDSNGHYSFSEAPGTYTVTVDSSNSTGALAGYSATATGKGTPGTDSNVNPSGTSPATLNSGASDNTVDFGYYKPVKIGDFVWLDTNGNGVQDNGELGIAGVLLTLTGTNAVGLAVTNYVTTDTNGYYSFSAAPGTYLVTVDATNSVGTNVLAGYQLTATGLGTTATDSNPNPSGTTPIVLTSGTSDVTIDFGYFKPVTIGHFVWVDTNGNGVQDDGEPGIPGVTLTLTGTSDAGTNITAHATTDSNGAYSFTEPPGTYTVTVDASNSTGALAGYTATVTGQGTTSTDSNVNPSGTTPATLLSGASDTTIDFGYYKSVTIGHFVWVDTNGNGVQYGGEPGIPGVTLTLTGTTDSGSTLTDNATTDANGYYSFTEPPGTYTVTVDASNSTGVLAGYTATVTGQGTTSTDSNLNPSGTTPATLLSGASDTTIDFGYFRPVTIGDFVWTDTNGNGVQDGGEPGIPGVTLTLTGTTDVGVAITNHATTDVNGHYSFSEPPGTYTVTVDASNSTGALAGYTATVTGQGSTSTDSNANPSGTTPTTLFSGSSDTTVDFGYYKPVKIGDFVWLDTNGNGIQEAGEPGIAGVILTLTGTNTAGLAITNQVTTDTNGYYSFSAAPGTYLVTVDATNLVGTNVLAGYELTAIGQGTPATDSNPNPSGTTPIVLTSGTSDVTIDFGYFKPVTIGHFVWVDTNGNGVQDIGEPGIPGVTLTLTGTSDAGTNITAHATTDSNGAYSFSEPPGTYTVTVDSNNSTGALAGYTATATGQGTTSTDSNVNPSGTTPATLDSGASDNTVDFGYYKPVTIGDFVWVDTNGNGIQDGGEPGIPGVTLTLTGTTDAGVAISDQTTTDINGAYSFSEPPGTYTVTVDSNNSTGALAGYIATAINQGTVATDSNVTPSGTTPATLLSGASDNTIDFGYYKLATIGDFVWVDTNGNGIQDGGEPGIPGVTLTLTGTTDTGAIVTAHATTDGNGHYSFSEPPGTYTVTVDSTNAAGALAGYTATATNQGTAATDSNVNPSSTTPATLLSGSSDTTVDFGYYKPVKIGDFVWLDTNGNGIQEAGEPGIAGVILTLSGTNAAGYAVTNQVTTDSNGYYLFSEAPGTYQVSVDATNMVGTNVLAGYAPTAIGLGTTETDSNSNPSPTSPSTLNSGMSDSSIDFGYYIPVTIGHFVWLDSNRDGVQEPGEPGISGVALTLTGTSTAGTNITDHATTDAQGNYKFQEPPGTYTVSIDAANDNGALSGYVPTITGQGTVSTDSNEDPSATTPALLLSGASDSTIDFGYIVAPPTAATLSYFSAQRHGNNQTLLTWRALVDVNVIGFLVDRQGPAGWVRITPHILPVIGDGRRPEVYNFSDVGGAKAYRLLTVDPQGGIQVVATVVPGVSAQSWISQDGKAINVQLVGTSNATVSVQTTTDLNGGNWTEAGTVTLDAQGNAQFSDAFDSTASKLFYRFSEK